MRRGSSWSGLGLTRFPTEINEASMSGPWPSETDPPAHGGAIHAAPRSSVDDLESLSRLKEIVRLAPIGIGIVDRQGRASLTNDALSSMLGYTPAELAELPFEVFTHPDDIARNNELFDQLMTGERDTFEMDKRFIHKEGHVVWGRLLVSLLREGNGEPSHAIGLLQDITEEKRLRDELERLASLDPLTELPNRRVFADRVDHHLRRARRDGGQLGAVLFADLDDFKTLNDTLGHQAGDDVLRAVAQRIASCLRPGDTASRFGGDEFAILLEDPLDHEAVRKVAERIRTRIVDPLKVVDRLVTPSVSLGITRLTREHDADRALSEADLAMYHGKGREDHIAEFTSELYDTALRRLEGPAVGRPSLASVRDEVDEAS